MSNKRKTNIIAIVLFVLLTLCAAVHSFIMHEIEIKNQKEAEALTLKKANDLARAFAKDPDSKLITLWAESKYPDAWGRQFILENVTEEKSYKFRSAGLDGVEGTDDDIVSEKYSRSKVDEIKTKVEEVKDSNSWKFIRKIGERWLN